MDVAADRPHLILILILIFACGASSAFTELDVAQLNDDSPLAECRFLFVGIESQFHAPQTRSFHAHYHEVPHNIFWVQDLKMITPIITQRTQRFT